jgi:hypothetical protein
MRAVGLIGSVVFGLAMTNIIWLLFIYNTNDESTEVFSLSAGGYAVKNGTQFVFLPEDSPIIQYTEFSVTRGNSILWTVGAALHALFDSTIWYVASCSCCVTGDRLEFMRKYKRMGNIAIIVGVFLIFLVSTIVVIVRASIEDSTSPVDLSAIRSGGLMDDAISVTAIADKSNVEFLVSYSVELVVSWFVMFPIVESLMFSGCCGVFAKVPVLGGRAYEMRQLELARQDDAEHGEVEVEHIEDKNGVRITPVKHRG